MKIPILRSLTVFEALLNTCDDHNEITWQEKAIEEFDHHPTHVFDIDHEFYSPDETIRFDIIIGYSVVHTLEPEGEFTPADHSIDLTEIVIPKISLWIGEKQFMVPVTKKKAKLITDKFIQQ